MKVVKKKLSMLFVMGVILNAFFWTPLPVHASAENTTTVAEYDLKEGGTQRFEIIDEQSSIAKGCNRTWGRGNSKDLARKKDAW